jgi:signal transduction histidine kinase
MLATPDQEAKRALLRNNRLFAGLPCDTVERIGAGISLREFTPEQVIFREGDPGDCLYLIIEGHVRISKAGRGGSQETLNCMGPGEFFGEMALVDGHPRSAQATASSPAVLGSLDAATFRRILDEDQHTLHQNFLTSAVERLRGINSHFITELMRNERLALVGTMANSIVHDLKNPLTSIVTCTEMLETRVPDTGVLEIAQIIKKAASQLEDMVQELLDFARGQSSLTLERHAAGSVLEELQNQFIRTLPPAIHVVRDIHFTDDVNVDLGRFARMLMNLVKNSIEAMPRGGILRLGLRQEGQRVIFLIGDTGCGIPPEMLEKIFEPFVSFGKSKGTGLGMAIARSVVESHGGDITVSSKVGIGTTVEVRLPALPVVAVIPEQQ